MKAIGHAIAQEQMQNDFCRICGDFVENQA